MLAAHVYHATPHWLVGLLIERGREVFHAACNTRGVTSFRLLLAACAAALALVARAEEPIPPRVIPPEIATREKLERQRPSNPQGILRAAHGTQARDPGSR